MRGSGALLLIPALALVGAARAQPVVVDPIAHKMGPLAAKLYGPHLATGPDGHVIVWKEMGYGQRLLAQRLDGAGQPLDPVGITLSTERHMQTPVAERCGASWRVRWDVRVKGSQTAPRPGVLLDPKGGPPTPAPDGLPCDPYATSWRADAGKLVAVVQGASGWSVDVPTALPVRRRLPRDPPAFAFDGERLLVAWGDPNAEPPAVLGVRVSATGERLDDEPQLLGQTPGEQAGGLVLGGGGGRFVVGPRSRDGALVPILIDGATLKAEVLAKIERTSRMQVSFDGRDFALAWVEQRKKDQRFETLGVHVRYPLRAKGGRAVRLARAAKGGTVFTGLWLGCDAGRCLTWWGSRPGTQTTGSVYDVEHSLFLLSQNGRKRPIALPVSAAAHHAVDVARADGGAVVAWTQGRSGQPIELRIARLDDAGSSRDGAGKRVFSRKGKHVRAPRVTAGGGVALVTWLVPSSRHKATLHARRMRADGRWIDKKPLAAPDEVPFDKSYDVGFDGERFVVVTSSRSVRARVPGWSLAPADRRAQLQPVELPLKGRDVTLACARGRCLVGAQGPSGIDGIVLGGDSVTSWFHEEGSFGTKPQLAAGDRGFLVAFEGAAARAARGGLTPSRILARPLDDDGRPAGDLLRLSDLLRKHERPRVGFADGRWTVSWATDHADLSQATTDGAKTSAVMRLRDLDEGGLDGTQVAYDRELRAWIEWHPKAGARRLRVQLD
jgi:hypothetical protein